MRGPGGSGIAAPLRVYSRKPVQSSAIQRTPSSSKFWKCSTPAPPQGFTGTSEALRSPAVKKCVLCCITPTIFRRRVIFSFNAYIKIPQNRGYLKHTLRCLARGYPRRLLSKGAGIFKCTSSLVILATLSAGTCLNGTGPSWCHGHCELV